MPHPPSEVLNLPRYIFESLSNGPCRILCIPTSTTKPFIKFYFPMKFLYFTLDGDPSGPDQAHEIRLQRSLALRVMTIGETTYLRVRNILYDKDSYVMTYKVIPC